MLANFIFSPKCWSKSVKGAIQIIFDDTLGVILMPLKVRNLEQDCALKDTFSLIHFKL